MAAVNCAYVLTHLPSGGFYVGSTSNPKRRLKEHLASLKKGDHHCATLQELFNNDPVVKVTEWFLADSREDAYSLEQEILDSRSDDPKLLNRAKNARLSWVGLKHSEETKEKIANSQRGHLNHNYGKSPSEEHRSKISKANRGYKHTPEAREKIRLSKLGKKLSSTHKEKLSKLHMGKTHTAESRAKMSLKKRGRVLTEAHRDKLKAASALRKEKGYISYAISVDGVVYRNLNDAIRKTGLTVSVLRRRLESNQAQYSGYFRIAPDDQQLQYA